MGVSELFFRSIERVPTLLTFEFFHYCLRLYLQIKASKNNDQYDLELLEQLIEYSDNYSVNKTFFDEFAVKITEEMGIPNAGDEPEHHYAKNHFLLLHKVVFNKIGNTIGEKWF